MGRILYQLLLAGILTVAFWAAPSAHAQAYGKDLPDCHRFEDRNLSIDAVLADPAGWICSSEDWTSDKDATWLRFDVEGSPGQPDFAIIRNARFEDLTVHSIGPNGQLGSIELSENAVRPIGRGPFFSVPLPSTGNEVQQIVIKIDQPQFANMGSGAYLTSEIEKAGWSLGQTILIAMIAGLVVIPLLFDISMLPILRRRFMLWHAAMAAGMLACLTMATGLAASFSPLTVGQLVLGQELGYVIIVAAGAFFTITFLEEFALSLLMRRSLVSASLLLLAISGGLALDLPLISQLDPQFFMLGFIPMLFASLAAMGQALLRGSVWVRYQIVGWTPAIVCGIDMIATGLAFQPTPMLGTTAPYFAMGFEVLITGVGVIHQLSLLKSDLDAAVTEARTMERLSECDPLTGLLNRRAVDARFEDLHRAGYETFAVLDLDHFKRVNDAAGHAVGDDVLKVVAAVLNGDEDSIAMRLGGEEFVLLMRGADASERAEKLRQTISVRIAREVPGLDAIVTASMGLVVIPRGAMPKAVFSDIYTHADRLLYEAKELGRNRTVSEQLRAFRKRSADRRKPKAA